jgi:hypothetical protein
MIGPVMGSIVLEAKHFSGSLSRHFFRFVSNAVSQHRRFAQALLILASPSAQVAQSCSCSRLLFGSEAVNFTRLYAGYQVGS